MASLNTIKNWFKTGLKPTQLQFWSTWESFWHKEEKIPINAIESLDERFNEKADADALTSHMNDLNAHGIGNLSFASKSNINTPEGDFIINWQTAIVPNDTKTFAQKHGNVSIVYQGLWIDGANRSSYFPAMSITFSAGKIQQVKFTGVMPGILTII
ncbi:hypothetical protein [Pedobacter sp. WC2423]|uniref:hypothetical protein n=1 Tax=Pedobacter sp. WC2423 TaxID=3234142 RepID=UPI003466E0B9